MNEIVAAEEWIYTKLAAMPAITGYVGSKIFGHIVPDSLNGVRVVPPYVLFTMAGTADNVNTVEAVTVWSELVYAIRVVAKVESYKPLAVPAGAIKSALHRSRGSNVNGIVVSSVNQAPFSMIEIDRDGFTLRHLGGLYRISVQ